MSKAALIFIIIAAVLLVSVIVMIVVGRRMQKKQDNVKAEMEAAAQVVSLLVIDKKKMKLKDANLPAAVYENAPKLAARIYNYPIAKVKVGPKVMNLMVEDSIYDLLPIKKECKVKVSGIYITQIISARGGIDKPTKKPGLLRRMRARAMGN